MSAQKSYPQQARTFGYLLRSLYGKFSKRLYSRLGEMGYDDIRPAHSAVLRYIEPEGNRLTELAELAEITKQSMAYLVDSLQSAGYLELWPDPKDGRAKLVRLTVRGEGLLATLLRISGKIENEIATEFGSDFAQATRAALERLDDALDA